MNLKVSERLFMLRKKQGLSQEELAEKIGVSRQAVSKWERGEASPDTDNLILLSKLYGISLDELLLGDDTDEKKNDPDQNSGDDYCDDCNTDTNDCGADNESVPESDESTDEPRDHVSFVNGIHVRDKDGSKVDISFGGIHVEDPKSGSRVHIDPAGVFVETPEKIDKNDVLKHMHNHKQHSKWMRFPYPIAAVLLFLLFGALFDVWHIAWIVFLTIPLYYSAVEAIESRKPNHFAYPVLTAVVYLYLGMAHGLWHPYWIVFLTIPLYYWIFSFYKK